MARLFHRRKATLILRLVGSPNLGKPADEEDLETPIETERSFKLLFLVRKCHEKKAARVCCAISCQLKGS